MLSGSFWFIVLTASSTPTTAKIASSLKASSSLQAFANHYPFAIRRSAPHPSREVSSIMHQHSDNHSSSIVPTKRMVLIGGGHAHVQVIKSLSVHSRPSHLHVTLIDLHPSASYSGMVPGCVSKLYTLDQVQIALDSLADWAGIEFVCGKVVGMSFDENDGEKVVLVEETNDNGNVIKKEIPFDVVSVDIGSTTRDFSSIPGASQYTISTRPISDLVRRIEREEEGLKERLDGAQVVVVGAGAAGIELCLALRARWNDLLDSKLSITLIDSNDMLLPSETPVCRSALKRVLEKYKIEVRHNLVVDEVSSSHVHVSSNAEDNGISDEKEKIPFAHCIWATGAETHTLSWDLHQQCGLSVSPGRGWIRVNKYLQSLSHPYVFAVGDCCEIVNEGSTSPPKAGVYAVRSGPILIENLTQFVGTISHSKTSGKANGSNFVAYHPQDDVLKLLMCGDGTALGFRFGVPFYGKWVWELKDHIDRMFVDLFDVKKLPTYKRNEVDSDISQYDQYKAKKERMKAQDACNLLLRTDDGVDFQIAWGVLREMMADENYREEVLSIFHESPIA